METPLTEVFASNVFALIMEQTVEVLDPGVVVLFAIPYEKQMDPSNVPWLLAESVDDHLPAVPAKDIQSEVVLLLHSIYLVDWCGRVNSPKIRARRPWGIARVVRSCVLLGIEPLAETNVDSRHPCSSHSQQLV